MKTYDEMANSALRRIHAHEQRRKKQFCIGAALSFLVVLGGFGIWQQGQGQKQETFSAVKEKQTPPAEEAPVYEKGGADQLGWIRYEGKEYVQVAGADVSQLVIGDYIGQASEMPGSYEKDAQTSLGIDGALYQVDGHAEWLLLRLENGGEVLLSASGS